MVWAGTKARQYAISALLAVCLTLLLARAWESNGVFDWAIYGACATLGVYVFMFFALAIVSHALAALVLRRRVLATFLASAVAAAVVLPFLLAAMRQTAQVSWIQDRSLIQNLTVAEIVVCLSGVVVPMSGLLRCCGLPGRGTPSVRADAPRVVRLPVNAARARA